MKIKSGVRVHGLRPEALLIIIAAAEVWRSQGQALTITSVIDGRHKRKSFHYSGAAVDFRIWDIDAKRATTDLAAALGEDYVVILESDHIHAHYQPERMI